MLRALELYCGIGGFAAAAAGWPIEITAAVDQNHLALEVYRHNFSHPCRPALIESLGEDFPGWQADLWWLSPPCQPYTSRGKQRDLDDPRAKSIPHVLARIERFRPLHVALENVPGFAPSRARDLVVETLDRCGYAIAERILCPSELGWPNRRKRYYLRASQKGAESETKFPAPPRFEPPRLSELLDSEPDRSLFLDEDFVAKHRWSLQILEESDLNSPGIAARCFTAGYGKSPIQSGAVLGQGGKVRCFSPAEILRLHGFSSRFEIPGNITREQAWRLIGNSLSLPAVREILKEIAFPRPAEVRSEG